MKPFSCTVLLFLILSGEIASYKISNVKPASSSKNERGGGKEDPSSSAISTLGVGEDEFDQKDDESTTDAKNKPELPLASGAVWAFPADIPDDVVFAEFQRRFGVALPESLAEMLARMKPGVDVKGPLQASPTEGSNEDSQRPLLTKKSTSLVSSVEHIGEDQDKILQNEVMEGKLKCTADTCKDHADTVCCKCKGKKGNSDRTIIICCPKATPQKCKTSGANFDGYGLGPPTDESACCDP